MARKPETVFRSKLVQLLHQIPYSWWESIQQKTICGTPDIIGCIKGKMVALEIKANYHSPPSPLQTYKLDQIKKAQGISFLIFPENCESILDELKKI